METSVLGRKNNNYQDWRMGQSLDVLSNWMRGNLGKAIWMWGKEESQDNEPGLDRALWATEHILMLF